jgi:hypothetical protein
VPIGAVICGSNGKILFHVSRLMDLDSGLCHPWMKHFRSAYPEHAQTRIDELFEEIQKTKDNYRAKKRSPGVKLNKETKYE